MNSSAGCITITLTTARQPGAVALIQLHGQGVTTLLHHLTGRVDWPIARTWLVDLGGVDQGLAVCLRDDWAQLMPHGGPRVVERLIDRLVELGAIYEPHPEPRALFPEAASAMEADVLATIARAASPAAVDLLAAQPELWRQMASRLAKKCPTACGMKRRARRSWRGARYSTV